MSQQETTPDDDSSIDTPFEGMIDADTFDAAISQADAVADEAVFEFEPDGLRINNIDPATVVLTDVTLAADAWDAYESGSFRTGFKLQTIADVTGAGDTERFAWDTDDGRLRVESGPSRARISGIDPSTVRTQDLKDSMVADAVVEFTIDRSTLVQAVRAVDAIGPAAIEFHAEPDDNWVGFRKHGDTDSIEFRFDDVEWTSPPDEHHMVLQSEDYMKRFIRAMPSDALVTVSMGTDTPTKYEYTHDGVHAIVVQAPRLEGQ